MGSGFLINYRKSSLVPSQYLKWLGWHWDTVESELVYPVDSRLLLWERIVGFVNQSFMTRRDLERIAGSINFISLLDPIGRIHLKAVNFWQSKLEKLWLRDSVFPVPDHLAFLLCHWLEKPTKDLRQPWVKPKASVSVYSDASKEGWGFHTSTGLSGEGRWSLQAANYHINVQEFWAAFLSAEGSSLAKGHFHRPNVGQHDSGQLSKKRRFFEVSDSQQLDSQGGCSRSREGVVPRSYSCEGVDERLGGHSVKILPDLHRVDGGRPILSVASRQPSDPVSSGRPVRLAFQREVTELRFSSGSTRRYRGRLLHGKLGQVGSSLSFPPSSSSFKGHQSPNPLQGEGGVACTLVARQTLVSSSSGPVPSTSGVPRPDPSSESEGQRVLCPVLLDLQASYLDFLRRSWNLKFDEEVANALCSALRESSYRQYSSVWKKFQCFVISRWPCKIDENLILKFFLFQFKNFNLSSRTIACYRSALSEPMKVGFGIELQKAVFSRLLRSFFLSRPPRQFSEPAWNLDLVLDLLCTPPFKTNISMVNLTLKTIFLVALALGCRASELHSLLRSPRYIVFSRNFKSVKIIPNPSFLCKNESLNFRRQPMILQAMMQRDGSHHTLCPVAALRKYLNVTKRFNGRGLFFNPVTRVPCNAARINYYVKFLVRKSQPNVYASFHDLRHFAAWRAFWSGMSYSGMRARGFWKSNSSLQKSYLAGSTPSSTPCVALGVVCKV